MNKEDEESDNESTTPINTINIITNNNHRDFKNIINSNLIKPQVVTLKKTGTWF